MREFEARLKRLLSSMPQGRPNNYDIIGYGSAYVVALAVQATGCQLTRAKLLDAWSNLKDDSSVQDWRFGCYPSGKRFTPSDHQGNYRLGAAIVNKGEWEVYRVLRKARESSPMLGELRTGSDCGNRFRRNLRSGGARVSRNP